MSKSQTKKNHKFKVGTYVYYGDCNRREVMRCIVDEVYLSLLGEAEHVGYVSYDLNSIIYDDGFPREKRYEHIGEDRIFADEVSAAKDLLHYVQGMMEDLHYQWASFAEDETRLQNFLIKAKKKGAK